MQEEHVSDVCRVGTHHKNDFNEVCMLYKYPLDYEIMDVLIDGGSTVNIISEDLWRKLGLKKP
jgi:hypothetical protein